MAAGAVTPPSSASDEALATKLLVSPSALPGWREFGNRIYTSESLLLSHLAAGPAIMRQDRSCAAVYGPTDPHQVTAVAVTGYEATGTPPMELAAEAIVYRTAAPVESDEAGIVKPDLGACIGRLLSVSLPSGSGPTTTHLPVTPRFGGLGDVEETAVAGTWNIEVPNSVGPGVRVTPIDIEAVFVAGSRAEVVLVFDRVGGPVPARIVERATRASAQELQALLG